MEPSSEKLVFFPVMSSKIPKLQNTVVKTSKMVIMTSVIGINGSIKVSEKCDFKKEMFPFQSVIFSIKLIKKVMIKKIRIRS